MKSISEINKHRADYYFYHTNKDWTSVENYDICINTSVYAPEQSVELIIECSKIFRTI